jgi:hypothetical protein
VTLGKQCSELKLAIVGNRADFLRLPGEGRLNLAYALALFCSAYCHDRH